MKPLSALFILTLLLTACGQTTEETTDEGLSFEEQAERDAEIAEQRQEEQFAQMEPTDDDGDGYKTFYAQEFGVSFTYPSNWIFDLDRYGEDGYRVDVSNEEISDACSPTNAHLVFTFPNAKESTLSFENFVKSPEMYEEQGSMGKLGGTLTPTTLAGKDAFQAESSGYESMCEDEAYVVEMNGEEYLFIGVFTGAEGNEADEVQKILDSLTL